MWNRNFIMVVTGQIISLFGNAVLRFALPLYLLNETGSAALFGVVTACAFIPMIVLGPVGGILADRVNKRNIMVVLDFSTAILVLVIILLLGKINLAALLLCALFILYGINGAYQPAVQASIPVLLSAENIMQGNAVINLVSCFCMAFLSTLFSIQIMSYLQMIVPVDLIGKVISCVMCIGMCASPIGQAIYGGLFEVFSESTFTLFFAAALLTVILAISMRRAFTRLEKMLNGLA